MLLKYLSFFAGQFLGIILFSRFTDFNFLPIFETHSKHD